VPDLQILLDCGQQGRQDDPGHEVQEEYFYEKKDGRKLGKERDVPLCRTIRSRFH
jgi:hypothetical protein